MIFKKPLAGSDHFFQIRKKYNIFQSVFYKTSLVTFDTNSVKAVVHCSPMGNTYFCPSPPQSNALAPACLPIRMSDYATAQENADESH